MNKAEDIEETEETGLNNDVTNVGGRYGEALYGDETTDEAELNSEEAGLDAGLGRDARQQSDMDEIAGDMVTEDEDDMDEVSDPNAVNGQDEMEGDDLEDDDTEEENPELMDVPM
jgi:hypothetical protein